MLFAETIPITVFPPAPNISKTFSVCVIFNENRMVYKAIFHPFSFFNCSTNQQPFILCICSPVSSWSFLWFPILQWQNKTFCKFWYFDSGKGLKLLVTIIVTGNNKWFTLFCFLSWFRKNEMWQNKTFWQNIKSWHRDDGLLQPMMCPNIYYTVLNHFQSQTLL